jgi:hypothetical protein
MFPAPSSHSAILEDVTLSRETSESANQTHLFAELANQKARPIVPCVLLSDCSVLARRSTSELCLLEYCSVWELLVVYLT